MLDLSSPFSLGRLIDTPQVDKNKPYLSETENPCDRQEGSVSEVPALEQGRMNLLQKSKIKTLSYQKLI